MNKKQLNRLADSRVCEIFSNESALVAACASAAILQGTNFLHNLATGNVVVLLTIGDILHCGYMPGDLSQLSCATIHELPKQK